MHSLARRALLLSLVSAAACAGDDAMFNVKYAPDYTKAGTISVFGIFRDGRMSPEAWDELGPRILKKKCESAYGPDMVATKPELSQSIDDYARHNGITDDLLAELAPLAKGDTILVVTISGRPPTLTTSTSRAPRMSTGMRGRGAAAPPPTTTTTSDGNAFEMSATLYSVKQRRSVALVAMTYGGRDTDRALDRFGARLAEAVPDAPCVGWRWDGAIDEAKLRKMADER